MTYQTMAQIKRKQRYQEFKVIESKLHPNPFVGGCEIIHTHKTNGQIQFTAWKNNMPVNDKRFSVYRDRVLSSENFYAEYAEDFAWLVSETK